MNIDVEKLHTTKLGAERINRNLALPVNVDVIDWCRSKTEQADEIVRKGKNWYVSVGDVIITINAYSHTIITAHKCKRDFREENAE